MIVEDQALDMLTQIAPEESANPAVTSLREEFASKSASYS